MDPTFCIKCGFKFAINAKFCGKCGSERGKIEPEEQKSPQKQFSNTSGSQRGAMPSEWKNATNLGSASGEFANQTCPECNSEVEFKLRNLFTRCSNCGLVLHSSGDEWNKWEKWCTRKAKSRVYGSFVGIIFGLFIMIGGGVMMVGAMQMSMLFAGQYMIIAIIVIVGGIVVIALFVRRVNVKIDYHVEMADEYELEHGYCANSKRV
jgi:ribosomal protein L40E/ribosomal protein S27E